MLNIWSSMLTISYAATLDGVSTAQQVVFLVLLFGSSRPIANSIAYISGIALAYLICGLIGLSYVDDLNKLLRTLAPSLFEQQGADYYQMQLLFGVILTILGIYFYRKRGETSDKTKKRLQLLVDRIRPRSAFVFGAFISSTSFPMAIPYIGALEKIAMWPWSLSVKCLGVVYYNVIYILPTAIPFLIYWLLRHRYENIQDNIHYHTERINAWMSLVMLSGIGLCFIFDSCWYMKYSKPFFESGLF